jgi:tetratricopeptide (TPR) repeat protein
VQQENAEIQKGEATVLRAIGLILARAGVHEDPPMRGHPTLPKGEALIRRLRDRALTYAGVQQKTVERKQPEWDCHWKALLNDPRRGGPASDGPFLNASLWYLTKALSLAPEDLRIRCDAARTTFAVHGNAGPLLGLKADSMVHLERAEIYRKLASACAFIDGLDQEARSGMESSKTYRSLKDLCLSENDPVRGPGLFDLARQEYREAVTRHPKNIDAMIGLAQTYWRRQIHHHRSSPRAPEMIHVDHARQAEEYITRAYAFANSSPDAILRATTRAHRGEILLASSQPIIAIEELEGAIEDLKGAISPFEDHPALDQIRWALSQAYRCRALIDKPLVQSTDALQRWQEWGERADLEFQRLASKERVSESQPFTGRLPLFAKDWGATFCQRLRFVIDSEGR